ncbi:alpha/beta hydrolase [Mucilaginibacter sp. SJ]|uniref:alpha/beta hydrolase n=1 Tax=Mucilaginibacter sp. SJ TaxID=3029053 RepID=UPI0023A9CD2E|nr:alpha/beta hydrolase [Mucilaginibacter sp. SJ]WEA01777.1 lysophospholipase [Mucilaginibacter sp. SJ]
MKYTGASLWNYQNMNFRERSWVPKEPRAVIVLIHGIGEHTGRYAGTAAFFNGHGLAVTGFDLYGHGESPGKRGGTLGMENTLAQLQSFVHMTTIEFKLPVVIYGHSMGGGLLAALLLRRRPPAMAAILSAPGLRITNTPPVKKALLRVLDKVIPNMQISQGFDASKLTKDTVELERYTRDKLNHGFATVRLAHEMISSGEWCIEHADQLHIPLLIMHGTADAFTDIEGSRQFNGKAPRALAYMLEWPGAYHELHNEPEREEILGAAVNWLEAIWPD